MEENISKTSNVQKNGKVISIFILALIAAGAFIGMKFLKPTSTPVVENTSTIITTTPTPSTATTPITLAEIAKHNSSTDCWFAIEGNVYDVTNFIASSKHPGGEAIIQGCGKDATTFFNTRPMGSGTPHSDRARSMLAKFQIGVLAK